MSELEHGPIKCVACGREHITTEDELRASTRVGISFIARECAWTLRYPGKEAHEVIEELESESRTRGEGVVRRGPAEPDLAVTDEEREGEAEVEDDGGPSDPAARVQENEYAETKVCSVCNGDGEVPDPENPESFNPCGRCGGEGKIKVTAE